MWSTTCLRSRWTVRASFSVLLHTRWASLLTAISDNEEEAAKVATAVIAGAVIVSPYIGIVTVQKLISNAADDELK